MEMSVFTEKEKTPTLEELHKTLGATHIVWKDIRDYVFEKYTSAVEEWNYPGKKYGWSYCIKDKKRAIIYFLPREGYFKVAFVFGEKATHKVLESSVFADIKKELELARAYAEGRGIRIDMIDISKIQDIKTLIDGSTLKTTFLEIRENIHFVNGSLLIK